MTTNNPKVSAYVPQHIFNKFKDYCWENNLSMSQAVGVIFAEYFGLDFADQDSPPTNGVMDRLAAIEQRLTDLEEAAKAKKASRRSAHKIEAINPVDEPLLDILKN